MIIKLHLNSFPCGLMYWKLTADCTCCPLTYIKTQMYTSILIETDTHTNNDDAPRLYTAVCNLQTNFKTDCN